MSPAWRRLLSVELPLMLGTVAFAAVAPARFVEAAFGIKAAGEALRPLVYSYCGVVFTLTWIYARLLFAPRFELASFRRFQEALLVGDVVIVASWSWNIAETGAASAAALGGIGLAAAWGAARVVFLRRHPNPAHAPLREATSR